MTEERKLVTILFADIVGSTAMTAARDPEVVRATLRRTFDELRPIIESHGGTVEKFIGDEVMAVFGVPIAHDDDADRAVRAAFAIRERVTQLSALPKAIPLELRIGINTGETVAGSGEGGQFLVTGEPVNAAARIRGSAEPGEIVVGALTYRLTKRAVEYGEPHSFEAKGLGRLESWPALALRSEVPTQFRGIEGLRAPLIGRDEELSLLLNAFERMRTEERSHLVTVFGAAGAGKSRLADEFIARLDGARIRQGRCLPYGEGITLWPIQLILRADAGIAPTDDLATARQLLRDAVVAAFPESADDVHAVEQRLEVLAGLARADQAMPEIAAADLSEELAWGLRRYLERRAATEPLVLVFEDIHWAAPALLELIEHLAEWSKAPLLLLCLARPEFLDTRPSWGGGKVNASSIVLEPLTPDETRDLVAKLLDIDSLSEDMRAAVIERAEGNPLYVEEFIRLLIESGQIGDRGGRWVVTNAGPLQVPPTLQGLIAARIDTAPPEVKTLLQRAAVVGRFFTTTGVAAVSDGKPPEAAHLRDAVRRDLLIDADERGVGGGRMYRFKHVLIREVAYGSVPKSERARLHDLYVRWYEGVLGDRREDFIDLIAYHAEQAYLLGSEMAMAEAPELARRAFDRLMETAAKARVREDDAASLALYSRAAAPSEDASLTPKERLELDAYLVVARHRVEATGAAFAAFQPVIERARAQGEVKLLIELLAQSLFLYPTAERLAARQEIRALAMTSGDPEEIVRAMVYRISDTSPFDEDLRYVQEALDYATAHDLVRWVMRLMPQLVFRERVVGRYSDAQRHLEEWERLLGANPSRKARADLLDQKVWSAIDLLDAEASLPLIEEHIALREELGDYRGVVIARIARYWALDLLGRPEEALEAVERDLPSVDAKLLPRGQRNLRLRRARVLARIGKPAEAAKAVQEALAVPTPWADVPDAGVMWSRAFVTASNGDVASAASLYRDARTEYDRVKNMNPVFTFDHVKFLKDQGRVDEARSELLRLRAWLSDPLAGRLRARTDELLAQVAAVTA